MLPFVLILRAVSPTDGQVAVLKTPFFTSDIIDNDEGQDVRGEFYADYFRLISADSTDDFAYGQLYSYKYIPNLLAYLQAQNVQNPFPTPEPDPEPEPGWQPAEPEVGEQPAPVDPVVFVNVPAEDGLTEHVQMTASEAAAQGHVDASLATTPAPIVEEAPVEAPAPVAEAPVVEAAPAEPAAAEEAPAEEHEDA